MRRIHSGCGRLQLPTRFKFILFSKNLFIIHSFLSDASSFRLVKQLTSCESQICLERVTFSNVRFPHYMSQKLELSLFHSKYHIPWRYYFPKEKHILLAQMFCSNHLHLIEQHSCHIKSFLQLRGDCPELNALWKNRY